MRAGSGPVWEPHGVATGALWLARLPTLLVLVLAPRSLAGRSQADFSYWFDTGGRRRCYIAPERFYTGSGKAPPGGLTPQMVRCLLPLRTHGRTQSLSMPSLLPVVLATLPVLLRCPSPSRSPLSLLAQLPARPLPASSNRTSSPWAA